MANVRGFRDMESARNREQGASESPAYNMPFLVQPTSAGSNPRKESFFDMIKYICCPGITLLSFIVIVTLIDYAMFAFSIYYGKGIKTDGDFLEIRPQALMDLGAMVSSKVRYQYELWRFITPVFLHGNFRHVLFNSFSQLIFGVPIEQSTGTIRTIIVYFISGYGGNLMSGVVTEGSTFSVGASTAIFGLLGSQLAFLILNWKAFDYPGSGREKYLFIIAIFIVYGFLMPTSARVDLWGHFGGLLTGMFLGLFVFKPIRQTDYEKNAAFIGMVLSCIYLIGGVVLFFTVLGPKAPQ